MSGNGELIKAGRIPATVIGAWEYTHMAICRGSEDEAKLARRAVARRVVDGKVPRGELWELLGMLGLR